VATFWNNYTERGGANAEQVSYNYASKIFVGSDISQRFVDFGAFVRDIKYTVNKTVSELSEKDKDGTDYLQKVTSVSMNINFDVPAHDVDHAKNNLIKISEIMRMISPVQDDNLLLPRVYILLSNLISSGNFVMNDNPTNFSTLKKNGCPGFMKDFTYEPDVEAGYFYDSDFRAPRNIKVSFNFLVEAIGMQQIVDLGDTDSGGGGTSVELDTTKKLPNFIIRGLCHSGEFTVGDEGGWPFGIKVRDSRHANKDYSYETLNTTDNKYASSVKSYFMIGNWYREQFGSRNSLSELPYTRILGDQNHRTYRTPVYCVFEMFLDNFKMTKKTNLEPKPVDNGSDVGIYYNNFADDNSEFSIDFSIVADDIEQAKKNCGKIQILFRLLLNENQWDEDNLNYALHDQIRRNVYIPNLLERIDSNKGVAPPFNSLIYDNGIMCVITKIDVNLNNDLGFFIDKNGSVKKYYPKGFSISVQGDIVGYQNTYAGRPKNYNSPKLRKKTGALLNDENRQQIHFPFKFPRS